MVDLVKIRKKAKERAEAGGRAEGPGAGARGPEEPIAEVAKTAPAGDSRRRPPRKSSTPAGSPQQSAATTDSSDEASAPAVQPVEPAPDAREPAAGGRPAGIRPPAPESPAKPTKLEKFKEQAGRRRKDADGIGRTTAAEPVVDERLEVLTFAIAGEHYAIDIERIVEIVPPRAATHVPNATESVVGIMSLRGTIVTLIDVRRRLTHASAEPTAETRIIVLEHEGETIGFEVDRVFRVVKIAGSDVAPHPVVHASEADESIRGVFRHDDSLTILLDFAKLLSGGESPRTGPREALASRR